MENNDSKKEAEKIDEEKLKEIEKIYKERLKARNDVKEKLKKKINGINFILLDTEIDEMREAVKQELEIYLKKTEELYQKSGEKWYNIPENSKEIEMKKAFNVILKEIFEELNILVKIKDEIIFDKKYIIFKDAESLLIAFLIENFNKKYYLEKSFETFLTKKKLEEFIKYFKVEENFIEKFKNEGVIEEIDEENLYIHFGDSDYFSENEPTIRKILLQSYNLKEIEKARQEIEKYNNDKKEISKEVKFLKSSTKNINDEIVLLKKGTEELEEEMNSLRNKTKELEKNINFFSEDIKEKANKLEERMEKSKIEGITILGIFVGIISYLSFNFSFSKEILSKGESLSFLITVSCIGLIPIVTLILLIKFLFLNSKYPIENDNFKKKLLEKSLPYLMGIFVVFLVVMLVISKNFKNDYKRYVDSLTGEEVVKIEKIEELEKEIETLKLKCEQQEKLILEQNKYKKNNSIIFVN